VVVGPALFGSTSGKVAVTVVPAAKPLSIVSVPPELAPFV
jgi:hypothetical protein